MTLVMPNYRSANTDRHEFGVEKRTMEELGQEVDVVWTRRKNEGERSAKKAVKV